MIKNRLLCENCKREMDNNSEDRKIQYMKKDIFPKCYNEFEPGYYVINGDEDFIQDKFMQYKFGMDNCWSSCILDTSITSNLHYGVPTRNYNAIMDIKEIHDDKKQQKIIDNIRLDDNIESDEDDKDDEDSREKEKISIYPRANKDLINIAILLLILFIMLANY